MNKLKVITIVGTRPEIIRLSCVIEKLEKSDVINHVLVHTGQNYDYELNEVFFRDFNLRKPDYFLDAAGITATETIGKILVAIEPVLEKEQPAAVLILGDTNSCLCAIAAKKKQIPIFHMEAGNRCFDLRVPEEINRRIVDHTADINLTYSSIAREYLLQEGLSPDMVIKTGSPMFEVLNNNRTKIDKSRVLEQLELGKEKYFVVSAHREENIDSEHNFSKLVKILNNIAEQYGYPVIVSTHPRTQKRIDTNDIKFHENIRLMKPLGFFDYIKLQIESKAVLSDSGTITEESSILNFPALNIREAHERPEGFEEASVMMVGLNHRRVAQGLDILENQPRGKQRLLHQVMDYGVTNVSDKVLRIIVSYVDYINRTVWHKS